MTNAAHNHWATYTCVLGAYSAGSGPAPSRPEPGEEPQVNPGAHRHPQSTPEGRKQLNKVSQRLAGTFSSPRRQAKPLEEHSREADNHFPGSPSNTPIPNLSPQTQPHSAYLWGLLVTKGVSTEPHPPQPQSQK